MIDLETVHLMKGGDELEERYGIKRGPFFSGGGVEEAPASETRKGNAHHC